MMMQSTDRTKMRMEKLRQLELEQLQWEQEALVLPEDLNRALFLSFESVKTEFSDLDGLSWPRPVPLVTNPWTVDEPTPKLTSTEIDDFPSVPNNTPLLPSPQRPRPLSAAGSSETSQDTVRISPSPSRSPLQPANPFFSTPSHKDHHPGFAPPNLALVCHGLRHG